MKTALLATPKFAAALAFNVYVFSLSKSEVTMHCGFTRQTPFLSQLFEKCTTTKESQRTVSSIDAFSTRVWTWRHCLFSSRTLAAYEFGRTQRLPPFPPFQTFTTRDLAAIFMRVFGHWVHRLESVAPQIPHVVCKRSWVAGFELTDR